MQTSGVKPGARALAGVSVTIFASGPSVVHWLECTICYLQRITVTHVRKLVLFPPEVKRTLPERKWNTPGGLAGSAVVMNMCFDSAGDLSSSAHVPGYGDISNLQIETTALPQRQRGENSNQLNRIKMHIILKLIVEMHGLEKVTGPQIIEADPD